MRRLLLTAFVSSFLIGCGGGSGSSGTSVDNTKIATNQAVLGPLSGATIYAYYARDLYNSIEGPILATTSTDIDTAGQFSLELDRIDDDEWILVSASSGDDIDANDDGIPDNLSTRSIGVIYGVAKASTWRAGEGKVTALSDIAWRYAQDRRLESNALASRLDALANWLIAQDITSDGKVNYDDLIRFSPIKYTTQAAIKYQVLLPSGDSSNPHYIDKLHLGYSNEDLMSSLETAYGKKPWIADSSPDIFSFAAQNQLDLNQSVESESIKVSGINRPAQISVDDGEYQLNDGDYTNETGTVFNGDIVRVRLTSASDNGTTKTAVLTINDVAGVFVTTTGTFEPTPEAFSFIDQTNAARKTVVESDAITVKGIINPPAAISISGGEYSINNAAFTNEAGLVNNGDKVKVQLTTSEQYNSTENATVTIGGVSDSFDVITTPYDTDDFLAPGGPLGTLGMPMVFINASGQSFSQGCHSSSSGESGVNTDPNCQSEEKPEHLVTFSKSFYMGAFEVTFDAWDACVADGGCNAHTPYDNGWEHEQIRGLRPVTDVSFDDIQSYITWLNGKTGLTFRLPSESEWEYAARAGTNTVYPWGNTVDGQNLYCSDCDNWLSKYSQIVGQSAANELGLHNMLDNVSEWTDDIYHLDYTDAPIDASARLTGSGGGDRVVRGGNWMFSSQEMRSAYRRGYAPDGRNGVTGFRLVHDL